MKKTENKTKYSIDEKRFKSWLILSIFFLIAYIISQVFIISNLSEILENFFIPLTIWEILSTSTVSILFYSTFRLLRWRNFETNLKIRTLQFEKDLNIQANELLKDIKTVEGRVRELEDRYILLEKDKQIKIKLKNQKEKPQYHNYKLKLDTLKDLLHEIQNNYNEIVKSELKILWSTKPKTLMKKIKNLSKTINFLSTQCEEHELKLIEKLEKKKK
ncbi:MAG: hypothetical protein ACFFFT_00095 [Candidatus Thorarchaeota archaeon]